MQFNKLFDDDRAVSPVIGVILMVAITVILAAVIGTFVLGLGDQVQQTTPNANFEFDYTNDTTTTGDSLEITHGTGDSLAASQVNVVVSGSDVADVNDAHAWADFDADAEEVSAGSSVTLNNGNPVAADGLSLYGATVRVTWASESGDTSATLATWTGPGA